MKNKTIENKSIIGTKLQVCNISPPTLIVEAMSPVDADDTLMCKVLESKLIGIHPNEIHRWGFKYFEPYEEQKNR